MPAYNFQPEFELPIMMDHKRHTIRAKRKRRPKAGDTCYLFVGMRRKGCRRLKERRCVRVQDIAIKFRRRGAVLLMFIRIDGAPALTHDEADLFAKSDGFKDLYSMADFWLEKHGRKWTHRGGKFSGDLIHWESNKEFRLRLKIEAEKAKIYAAVERAGRRAKWNAK
jgi:hypothetical protein